MDKFYSVKKRSSNVSELLGTIIAELGWRPRPAECCIQKTKSEERKKRTEKGESAGSLLSSCTTLGLRRRLFSPATVDALMAKFWLQGRLGCRGGGTGQKLFLFFHPALLSLSLCQVSQGTKTGL